MAVSAMPTGITKTENTIEAAENKLKEAIRNNNAQDIKNAAIYLNQLVNLQKAREAKEEKRLAKRTAWEKTRDEYNETLRIEKEEKDKTQLREEIERSDKRWETLHNSVSGITKGIASLNSIDSFRGGVISNMFGPLGMIIGDVFKKTGLSSYIGGKIKDNFQKIKEKRQESRHENITKKFYEKTSPTRNALLEKGGATGAGFVYLGDSIKESNAPEDEALLDFSELTGKDGFGGIKNLLSGDNGIIGGIKNLVSSFGSSAFALGAKKLGSLIASAIPGTLSVALIGTAVYGLIDAIKETRETKNKAKAAEDETYYQVKQDALDEGKSLAEATKLAAIKGRESYWNTMAEKGLNVSTSGFSDYSVVSDIRNSDEYIKENYLNKYTGRNAKKLLKNYNKTAVGQSVLKEIFSAKKLDYNNLKNIDQQTADEIMLAILEAYNSKFDTETKQVVELSNNAMVPPTKLNETSTQNSNDNTTDDIFDYRHDLLGQEQLDEAKITNDKLNELIDSNKELSNALKEPKIITSNTILNGGGGTALQFSSLRW